MAKKQVIKSKAKINVLATFNNTVITIADTDGNVLLQESAGSLGFKGARKSTPYAATVAMEKALVNAKQYGVAEVRCILKDRAPAGMRF